MKAVQATAHANIALAKYWGKANATNNLPAVPSLSLTLEGLRTTTRVFFDSSARCDEVYLDAAPVEGRPLERVVALLDQVRALAQMQTRAVVESRNEFPTAAGLASSASGFAALALAATHAAGLHLPRSTISSIARRASASAARSLWGGYVALPALGDCAEPIAATEHLPLYMLVVLTTRRQKKISSTEGMALTASTSPYYRAWTESAPLVFEEIRCAILDRDVERLGAAAEHSALAMHASMLAARPALRYFSPATLSVIDRVYELRSSGLASFVTMDAGPNVKVLTTPEHANQVEQALRELPEAVEVIRCSGGPDAYIAGDA
ncbi:MAG TPA: diphosphomevalonate decarboxylase [Polyangiaceae bacterium]|nr:diphosphomevalonate decarboxylase [Polyangiaceae bacterium]